MKIVLDKTATNLDPTSINENFRKIETEFNDKILYRANPLGEPNEMGNPLDMDGNRIYNLPPPVQDHEAARWKEIKDVLPYANAAKASAAAALVSENNARNSANRAANSQRIVEGIEQVLGDFGDSPPVLYTAGLLMEYPTQTVSYNNVVYAPNLEDLPFTTSGTFETDKFRVRQGVVKTDLTAPGGSGIIGYQPKEGDTTPTTVEDFLDTTIRSPLSQNPVNKSRLWLSEMGNNPETTKVYARSTPETATLSIHEHLDRWGAPSRYYKWGAMTWLTNPNTGLLTAMSGVSEGYKVRGLEAVVRQSGDDGEGHALEIAVGQTSPVATVSTVSGSPSITNLRNFRLGARFSIGNIIKGPLIPMGATIVSLTKDGKTYDSKSAQNITVVTPGTGYVVGDILTKRSGFGGTWSVEPIMKVRSVDGSGGVVTVFLEEAGNNIVPSVGSFPVDGGTGNGATFRTDLITAGMGYPDSMELSMAATGTSSNTKINAYGVDNNNIGILITGSGDGGTDGTGTGNAKGIAFNSYADSKFKIGIQFNGHIRPDGTGIQFAFENSDSGIFFDRTSTFATGAIYLRGQNIVSDDIYGMRIGSSPTQKIGFWGATPIAQKPAMVSNYLSYNRILDYYSPQLRQVVFTGAADGEAKLNDLNSLREAYENLREHHESLAKFTNQLVKDLQDIGIIKT